MIKFSRHAKDRLLERKISQDDVTYCLKNYHTSYADKSGKIIYRTDLPDGRHIKVVVRIDTNDHRIIVTVADY